MIGFVKNPELTELGKHIIPHNYSIRSGFGFEAFTLKTCQLIVITEAGLQVF